MTDLLSQIYLKLNGRYAPDAVMQDIKEISIDTSLLLPSMFTIRLQDTGMKWVDSQLLDLGKSVSISGRAEGSNRTSDIITQGEITAIEPDFSEDQGAVLIVRGYDRSHRLYRGKKSRVFNQMTNSDIVLKIAQECSLKTMVDSTTEVYEHVFQVACSDMEFLQERADNVGYYLYVEDGILNFRREPGKNRSVSLDWGNNLIDLRVRLTTAEQVNQVEVHGWDSFQKIAIVGKSDSPDNAPEINGENNGGKVAKKSFGISSEEVVSLGRIWTQSEADNLAQSILNERNNAFFEADGTCRGDPAINAGVEVDISGIGKRFSGHYRISRAVHHYDYSGYTTRIEVSGYRSNTLGQLLAVEKKTAGRDVIAGIVTNVNDPEGLARVKVKFPAISDELESNWARLVTPMAGAGRGFEFIPEVNDEVLVAFENGDINKPYVLGSLWNGIDKPPEVSNQIVASNGKVQKRIIQSRSGHKITIDDSDGKEKITIIDKTGKNYIDIDSATNQINIKTEGNIEMEAKGKINLKGSDIVMEAMSDAKMKGANVELNGSTKTDVKSANIDINASALMKIKSSGSASLSGGGMLELQGGLVKIN